MIDLMREIEQLDPVREGVFVTRGWETIFAGEEHMIFKANIGPGVDVFIKQSRDGEFGQLLVRATGKVYDAAKKAIDESGEKPTEILPL